MTEHLSIISDILQRFHNAEVDLDKKISQLEVDEENLRNRCSTVLHDDKKTYCSSLESAKLRNKELLKSLEVTKAKLRSRAAYSPTEDLIETATQHYLARPSLMPVRKKLYGPTFV